MPQERVEQFIQARKLGRNRFKALCGKGDLAQTVGATPVTNTDWTVWARLVSDPDPMIVYFTPTIIPFTILVHNLPILLRIEDDGRYWISGVDYGDYLAAIGGNVLPVNYADFIHTHANNSSGGQLNASQIFNAGAVAQTYGGTGANLSASSVGSIFYQNAFGQFVALAAVASGNVLRSAGLTTAPAYGKVVMTTDITGITPVANGGTGKSSNTTGVLLLGAGASAMTELAPSTSGNLAQSNGTIWTSAAPSFAASVITSGQLVLERGGTEADLSATGAGHLIQATTGAAVSVIKDNFAATAAPTVNEDSGDGYAIGSLWMDTTNDHVYMAIDVTVAAAVWLQLDGGGVGSSPFVQGTGEVYLDNPTDSVIIGDTGEDLGRFTIRGIADEPQLAIRLNGTQTQPGVLIQNSAVATVYSLSNGGDIYGLGALEIDGAFNHDGSTFGALGAAPAAQQAQTVDLKDALVTFGFYSGSGGATPLDTDGGLVTAFIQGEASTTSLATLNIPDGTAPTSPVSGDIWKTSTYQTLTARVKGNNLNAVWTLFTKTDLTTVSGTTSETSILGTVIPSANTSLAAGFFTAGTCLLIQASGFYSVSSGSDTSCVLRVKLTNPTPTTVNVFAIILPTLTGSSNQVWRAQIAITCRSAGGSGSFTGSGDGLIANVTPFSTDASTSFVDTTVAQTLDVSIDPNTSNTSWRCSQLAIQVLN